MNPPRGWEQSRGGEGRSLRASLVLIPLTLLVINTSLFCPPESQTSQTSEHFEILENDPEIKHSLREMHESPEVG